VGVREPDSAHDGFRHLLTDRLELRAFSVDDLDEVYRLMSDPRVWRHFPAGMHTSPRQSAAQLSREEGGWDLDGLGYWTAWLRDADGTFAGVGGCRRHATTIWNLYYRIRPELQGNGYATELARAAIEAARVVDPALPVVASVLGHNAGSRAVATAVGLRPVVQREEAAGLRLLYCDRHVETAVLERLLGG